MLKFKNITIDDKEIIESYYKRENYFMCDYCFVDLVIWAKYYHTQYCENDGFLYVMFAMEDGVSFLPPIGDGDISKAVGEIIRYCENIKCEPVIGCIPEPIKKRIEEAMPGVFNFEMLESNRDYIYDAKSLIELSGKKFHKKKNHVNRFLKEYDGRWSYEDLNDENLHDFFYYQLKWTNLDNEFLGELGATATALKNYKKLGIKGGILRLDGEIIGVTLGVKAFDDTFIIQIEKAEKDIHGAYQMINREFAARNCAGVKYIDREEDLGIESLRKAKESYFPLFRTPSYIVRMNK